MSAEAKEKKHYDLKDPEFSADLRLHEVSPLYQEFHHTLGMDVNRRYNLHYIDFGILLYASGNTVQLLDLHTQKKTVLCGVNTSSNCSIACVTVHPDRNCFAVAEKGVKPRILIYSYVANGTCEIINVLREGTTKRYADIMFSPDGTQLASVGGEPDYLLTVWDWQRERVTLRTKAFSQEVYHVEFSHLPGQLTTSGSGHIKFWKMANTFTGLKLQGAVAKFGSIELSDVAAFAVLPNGKVLSGSEPGALLMWDGNFIQFAAYRGGGIPAHNGSICYIKLEDRTIITAGADGYIRMWNYADLEYADPSEPFYEVDPLAEFKITDNPIQCLLRETEPSDPHWIALDSTGVLFKVTQSVSPDTGLPAFDVKQLVSLHAGKITGLACNPGEGYLTISCGEDGTVRCWDVSDIDGTASQGQLPGAIYTRRFNQPCTCLVWIDREVDFECRLVLVGFADGVVRLLCRYDDHFKMLTAFKPHRGAVVGMAMSPDGKTLATLGEQKDVFFHEVMDSGRTYEPIGFAVFPSAATSLVWRPDSSRILVACGLDAVELTAPSHSIRNFARETFRLTEQQVHMRSLTLQIPPEPIPEPEEQDVDSEEEEEGKEDAKQKESKTEAKTIKPDLIAKLIYAKDGSAFYVALDGGLDVSIGKPDPFPGPHFERLYTFTFDSPVPVAVASLGENSGTVSSLNWSSSKNLLIVGTRNGSVSLRPSDEVKYFLSFNGHDADAGGVTAAATSTDDAFLVTAGSDGVMMIYMPKLEAGLKAKKEIEDLLDGKEMTLKQDFAYQLRREGEGWRRQVADEMKDLEKKSALTKNPIPKDELSRLAKIRRQNERRERIREREEGKVIKAKIADIQRGWTPRDLPMFDRPEHTEVRLPSDLIPVPEGKDITEAHVYSIEENKLKQEEDDRVTAGEEKKNQVRRQISLMRAEFKEILSKNRALPTGQKLGREAFELDPKLREHIEEQTRKKIDTVRAELAWESEKYSIALSKLRQKFLDNLLVEHIEMRSFRTGMTLSCFRTPELPPFLKKYIEMVSRELDTEDRTPAVLDIIDTDNDATSAIGGKTAAAQRGRERASGMGEKSAPGKKTGITEAQRRKKIRDNRKAEMDALMARKPSLNADDAADISRIEDARKNMGDYKLKSAADYKVPEHMRMNAERKQKQMAILQESVQGIKTSLNQKFLALRDLKRTIIETIKNDNVHLRELNRKLGIEEELFEPELDPNEWPESRDQFTQEDITKFEEHQAREKQAAIDKARAAGSLFANTGKKQEESKKVSDQNDGKQKQGESKEQKSKAEEVPEWKQRLAATEKSELELCEERMNLRLWRHERAAILNSQNRTIDVFDSNLAELRREKFKLDSDLKTTDLKVLTLYQELQLLKNFGEQESHLFTKFREALQHQQRLETESADTTTQFNRKKAEIQTWNEEKKKVIDAFQNLVAPKNAEKHEFYGALTKLFNKGGKRRKKRDDEDSEEENDMDDSSGSDDEEDSEEEKDEYPVGCDQPTYDEVRKLREKKIESEDILADFLKVQAELSATRVRHEERKKKVQIDIERWKDAIEEFQTQKQRALNAIRVTVPLKLHQLKYLQDDRLPADISSALIFTTTGMTQLTKRIEELQQETEKLKEDYRKKTESYKEQRKQLNEMERAIAEEVKRCEGVQMLKFGRKIDLSILAKVGLDEGALVLRGRLKTLEATSVRKLNEWDKKISGARDELSRITRENTQWLERVAQLTKAQYDLEHQLNATTKNVHIADTRPSDEKENAERRQLLSLVQIQEKEIDALKAEIHVLRRKGGHVYTPQ